MVAVPPAFSILFFADALNADAVTLSFLSISPCPNIFTGFKEDLIIPFSCNTTGLSRVLGSIDRDFGISSVTSVIARRAVDPDVPKGMVDSVSLDPVTIPSHHGPDVNTILPDLNIVTMAIKIPTTHNHVHSLIIDFKDGFSSSPEDIASCLRKTPRVMLVSSANGVKSTAHTFDLGREMGRDRGDIYESMVWEDSITVKGSRAYMYMAVAQESICLLYTSPSPRDRG